MTGPTEASPFHAGEKAMQTRIGKPNEMEEIGRRMIRSFMPDQHRHFLGSCRLWL